MARKPITQYAGGQGPRQRIWNAIRLTHKLGDEPFTDLHIWKNTAGCDADVELRTVREYRAALVAAGVLQVVVAANQQKHVPGTYALIQDEGMEAPRVRKDGSRVTQGLAQEQMWRTLRTLKADVNARELAAHASTSLVPVAETAAKDYIKRLKVAGYITITAASATKGRQNKQARYRLTKNTGPRPPMVQRTDALYDPNLDQVVWIKPVNEETAIYGS